MQDAIEILLVDDEPRNLDVLESILAERSYRLLRAGSAEVALKLLLEHEVAAIVLDVKMPGVSGFELAQLIKGSKKFREIPIVFLTAYLLDDKDVLTGYGAGAVDYLTKPVNPQVLRHKIAVFADLFRKTRALADLNEKLEARVAERTAELERANRMKDEFLATVSHELRTPLNSVLGWATILKNNPNPDKLRRGLDVIERNARAQERLVTDLLDVSRIIAGKLRLRMQAFPLADAICAATDVVRNAATAKGVHLTLDLDPSIGITIGDPERLQQVVWNLLVNAVRHTPPGGQVSVTARREASANVVRVTDTGSGIPSEHLPHIFERFRQVDGSITRAHGGLGLGLALVRHLVEGHGGEVRAESEGAGRGATFTVILPVPAVNLADAEAAGETSQAEALVDSSVSRVDLSSLHVLVVEDDQDSLELVRVVLEGAGARVTSAGSAVEAFAALHGGQRFDVVVSDIGMPEIDGYTLVERMRASGGPAVSAVALTAYARGDDVERARKAGFEEHLAKPIDPRRLIETVRRLARGTAVADETATAPATGELSAAAHPGLRLG